MYKTIISILLFISALHGDNIKSPAAFLGYGLGEKFTFHHKVVSYFKHVSDASPNVKLISYGKTYEQRPLLVAVISSEENINIIEDIRLDNLKRAGVIKGKTTDSKVGIVWLSYNVHGNEANSTEAAMKTLYALTNKENKETQAWLENTVVILDPCINPDGRDRYANWFRMTASRWPDANPLSIEHMEPWPGGRTNHYYFDLNRDWAWQTQIESQSRIKLYNQWLPHIHVDFHEQGVNSPYYFAPAAEPFHEYITDWQRELQTMIGKNHSKYFDKNSWLYFTKEVFDLLYPSYGDTYPTYNGAIGMTYEQAGHSRGGLAVETEDGDTLTLNDRLTHHYTTGLSTIEVASNNVDKILLEFSRFFEEGKKNPPGKYTSYIISKNNNEDKIKDLKSWLNANGIEHGLVSTSKSIKGFSYLKGKTEQLKVSKGDIIISAKQSKSVLVQILFEPQTTLRDTMTYDITAWSIPYVFGLKSYAVKSDVKFSKARYFKPKYEIVDKSPYAYLLPWEGINDVRFLANLFKNDIVSRVSEEPFSIEGREFNRGTLVITRKGNEKHGSKFDEIIKNAGKKYDRRLFTVNTGFVTKGKDFGSSSMRVVKRPKIGLVSGDGVSSSRYGEVWHYFERQIEFPVTVLGTDYFMQIPKHNFDILIFPGGGHNYLDREALIELRSWVRSGGKLIVMDSSLDKFVDQKGFGLKKYATDVEKESSEKRDNERELSERLRHYKDRQRSELSQNAYGSIIKIKMDKSHPLAFGYGDEYFSLKLRNNRYAYLHNGWNVGTVADSTSIVSGFVGYKAQENFRESMVFGVEDIGRGSIIYMADNPLFRGFWYNGKLLFANAIFIVGN